MYFIKLWIVITLSLPVNLSSLVVVNKAQQLIMIRVGMRVVRGPNWRWGDQDSGEGHIGTVTKNDAGDKCVAVEWDKGNKEKSMSLELGLDSSGNIGNL